MLTAAAVTLSLPHEQAVYTPIELPCQQVKNVKPKRNPFLAPVAAQSENTAYMPQPALKGILHNGSTSMAIIEYGNQSIICRNGDKIGSFTVNSISSDSVQLKNGNQLLTLKQGGQINA